MAWSFNTISFAGRHLRTYPTAILYVVVNPLFRRFSKISHNSILVKKLRLKLTALARQTSLVNSSVAVMVDVVPILIALITESI